MVRTSQISLSANETLMKQVSMSTGETTFDKQLSRAAGQM